MFAGNSPVADAELIEWLAADGSLLFRQSKDDAFQHASDGDQSGIHAALPRRGFLP